MSNDYDLILKIKDRFHEKLKKGQVLDWNSLVSPFLNNLTDAIKENLYKWHQSILDCHFLNHLPESFEEIFIHDADDIKIKYKNHLYDHIQEMTRKDIESAFDVICIKNGVDWNYNNPFASFYINKKGLHFRATLIHEKISPLNKAKFFLRLISKEAYKIESFAIEEIKIKDKIINKKNILIAGATGSGKTSFINSLINFIPSKDHLLVLEDTFELQIDKKNTTRLLSSQDQNQSLDKLLTYSLRMSPDRIILGELRSLEISTYIQALNTGHRGVLSTIHANSAKDAIFRAANLFQLYSGINMSYELALKLVSTNVDYVIFLENKKVKEIIEVFSSEGTNLFFDLVA